MEDMIEKCKTSAGFFLLGLDSRSNSRPHAHNPHAPGMWSYTSHKEIVMILKPLKHALMAHLSIL